MWSGPRNISTAMMRSFGARPDTVVVDEPLYAHYLRVSGAPHPGREAVLAAQENDGEQVVRDVILGTCDRPVLFLKQMAHHLVEIDRAFLAHTANVLLTRDPVEMLPSLRENIARPKLADTGYAVLTELFEQLRALGQEPPVLDARELLRAPHEVLRELCRRLGIPFEDAMLSWKPGPRPEDGVWAPHWYANVHRSRGFEPYREKSAPFPPVLEPLLAECRPHYAALARVAIRGRGA